MEVGPGGRGTERPAIYDVDAIHEKLEDIGWTSEQPWEETIVIMSSDATQLKDVDDDLARELSFYNQVGAKSKFEVWYMYVLYTMYHVLTTSCR